MSVHVSPLRHWQSAWFSPSVFPSATIELVNCEVPVQSVHVSAVYVAPPSVDSSIEPVQAFEVGSVICTPTNPE